MYKKLLDEIEPRLTKLYGSGEAFDVVKPVLDKWENETFDKIPSISQNTVYMITYGDSIFEANTKTLTTLHKFTNKYLKGIVTDIHLLPMFEYTSDDGFSVVDFRKVDPALGDFSHIDELKNDYKLMFDFVANHVSKSSEYFKKFVANDPEFANFFIEFDENEDYSNFTRPRTSPLFHEYENGHKALTTFSEDQVDVNIKNPKVLAELTDVLLYYAKMGATSIRLDAIGFLWKESGTTSLHLEQTHEIIKIWRKIMDHFKPNTQIITETNVPHKENISYFGAGDEANMVYQFALPPLVFHSFVNENAKKLSDWASAITLEHDTITYFNFLSSHDGIGLRPTEGILTDEERTRLADRVTKNGGKISYKSNSDGSQSVYELNINYHEAIVNKDYSEELQIKQIIAANAILFSVIGVPAIYYHSLLGSGNDYVGLEKSNINRRINREKLEYNKLVDELENSDRRKKIFGGIKELIETRKKHSAFNPYAKQKVLQANDSVFAIERHNVETDEKVQVFVNVSNSVQKLDEYSITLEPFQFIIK